MSRIRSTSEVAIVGAGPAGLMLAHLLHRAGVDSVVIDIRSRTEIEQTHRAGILEPGSVDLLVSSGVSDRVLREGHRHEGIDLAFGGAGHRIDFPSLTGAAVQLYPQTDVFVDLADARARDGGDVRFAVTDVSIADLSTDRPLVRFTDADGSQHEIAAQVVVGSDGSRSICRDAFPESARRQYFREYPFAWFGILCEAGPSSPELVYNHSVHGFALISQRTESLQRMYFQCDPAEEVNQWPDDRIWEELQRRVGANGYTLKEGPITSRAVLPFRSFVQEPMRHGRLVLAGDAAHTVPPTGAKGLNLALADVRVLAVQLDRFLREGDQSALDAYSEMALDRVWRAQNFSYWMTSLLHLPPGGDAFDVRRQVSELASLARSEAGSTYLAEGYTGWPGSTASA